MTTTCRNCDKLTTRSTYCSSLCEDMDKHPAPRDDQETMTMPTTLARHHFVADIFTTALEGGIGYWSQCTDYHWCNDDGTDDLMGFYADIVVPAEDLSEAERAHGTPSTYTTLHGDQAEAYGFRIDRTVMLRGLRLAATTPVIDGETHHWQCGDGRPPLVITDDVEWDYDACDADAIVQYGLFGKVIFG